MNHGFGRVLAGRLGRSSAGDAATDDNDLQRSI
jgi:hypothetical protein